MLCEAWKLEQLEILNSNIHSSSKETQPAKEVRLSSPCLSRHQQRPWHVRVTDPAAPGKMDRLMLSFFWKRVYTPLTYCNEQIQVQMVHLPRLDIHSVSIQASSCETTMADFIGLYGEHALKSGKCIPGKAGLFEVRYQIFMHSQHTENEAGISLLRGGYYLI